MSDTPQSESPSIDRRQVLQAAGTAALGATVMAGTASAHPPEEIRFCDCSTVCVDTTESYRILYATEPEEGDSDDGDGEFTCRLDPATDEPEPRESDCISAEDGELIVGVLGGSRYLYRNPHTCAWDALDAIDPDDCAGCVDDNCADAVELEYVDIRTYAAATRDDGSEQEAEPDDVLVRLGDCSDPTEWPDRSPEDSETGDGSSSFASIGRLPAAVARFLP